VLFFEWQILQRRWYAVLLGLLLTLGLIYGALRVVPPSYEAEAQITLLPPKPVVGPENPYLNLGGLTGVSDALARSVNASATEEALTQQGRSAEFLVQRDTLSPAPILVITVVDSSPAEALQTLRAVLLLIPQILEDMQTSEGVSSDSLITSRVLNVPATAEKAGKQQLRTIIVALGVGLALTWLSAVAFDAWLRRRRKQRENRAVPGFPPPTRIPPPTESPQAFAEPQSDPADPQAIPRQPGQTPQPPTVQNPPSERIDLPEDELFPPAE
jgi:hypothetical protein